MGKAAFECRLRPQSLVPAAIAVTLDHGEATPINAAHSRKLFDFRFLELDVLARIWFVLAKAHLLGLVPRVLLGDVVEASPGGGQQFDFLGYRLSLCRVPEWPFERSRRELKSSPNIATATTLSRLRPAPEPSVTPCCRETPE